MRNATSELRRLLAPSAPGAGLAKVLSYDATTSVVRLAYRGTIIPVDVSQPYSVGDMVIFSQGRIIGKAESTSVTVMVDWWAKGMAFGPNEEA